MPDHPKPRPSLATPVACPRCHITLDRRVRGGVEIDVCGTCRGIWLDAGELDSLTQLAIVVENYRRDLADDGDADLLPSTPAKPLRARR